MTTKARAKIGGEYGANGEWYEGGKFLNTVAENAKKHGSKPKVFVGKQQIAAYKWEVAPVIGQRAIFSIVGCQAKYIDQRAGGDIMPNESVFGFYGDSTFGHKISTLCEMFNAGQRWITPIQS